jgi:hypothetical protein
VSRRPSAGLNLGFTKGEPPAGVRENRRLFFQQLGVERFALASLCAGMVRLNSLTLRNL